MQDNGSVHHMLEHSQVTGLELYQVR